MDDDLNEDEIEKQQCIECRQWFVILTYSLCAKCNDEAKGEWRREQRKDGEL